MTGSFLGQYDYYSVNHTSAVFSNIPLRLLLATGKIDFVSTTVTQADSSPFLS